MYFLVRTATLSVWPAEPSPLSSLSRCSCPAKLPAPSSPLALCALPKPERPKTMITNKHRQAQQDLDNRILMQAIATAGVGAHIRNALRDMDLLDPSGERAKSRLMNRTPA